MRPFPRHAWSSTPADADAAAAVARLGEELDLPLPVARVLSARGLCNAGQAERFLAPRLADLDDPFALPDMEAAVGRLRNAIARHESIVIFADFDADGVSAAAVLSGVLAALGARVGVFHPERLSEGYGLTAPALERCLREHTAQLLVTVDCGIRSIDEVAAATAAGLDVIVTDHHEPGPRLPAAVAVVNPKRESAERVKTPLAGVGVAFKLCHALVKIGRAAGEAASETLDLRAWLDVVALGTVADVVPLVGENRILVAAGIDRLTRRPAVGLRALMNRAGVTPPLGGFHLAYLLGPRINAAGRMASATTALALLTQPTPDEARALAARLDQLNVERRAVEARILLEALSQMEGVDAVSDGAVVVSGHAWHPGTIGIVAARLAETFNRPAAVISLDTDGLARGSLRSAAGVDLLSALEACAPFVESFGGHACAAGLRLRADQVAPFAEAFMDACRKLIPDKAALSELRIDGWLLPGDVTPELHAATARLEPFGEGHPMPCWGLRDMRLRGPVRRMGKDGAHMRFSLRGSDGGQPLDVVAFNIGDAEIPDGPLDVAFTLQMDRWQGSERLRLKLADLRPA